ncbi:MAG: hypothetical protein AB1736_00690 [Chloroflexota bacterium]
MTTDQQTEVEDTRLAALLSRWFEGEVRQAAVDIRRAGLQPVRARSFASLGIAAPATGVVLLVALVVTAISQLPPVAVPATEPTGGTVPPSATQPQATDTSRATDAPDPTIGVADRYRDGIPQSIDAEYVLRQGVLGHQFPVDDSPFLIGGWLLHVQAVRSCPAALSPLEPCLNPVLSRTPLERLDALPTVLGTHPLDEGPVILRVHVNDRRAIDCREDVALTCRSALVVEEVLWTDDAVSRTAPIGTIHAMRRLASIVTDLELSPVGSPIDPPFGEDNACSPGYPVQTWVTPGLQIAQVLVFPSVAARDAVDHNFTGSGWFGTRPNGAPCGFMTDSFYSHTWVVAHNVMVAVLVNVDGASPAQQALVDEVTEALREP